MFKFRIKYPKTFSERKKKILQKTFNRYCKPELERALQDLLILGNCTIEIPKGEGRLTMQERRYGGSIAGVLSPIFSIEDGW